MNGQGEGSCIFKLQRVHWKVSTLLPFDVARLEDHLSISCNYFLKKDSSHTATPNLKAESLLEQST